MLDGFDATLASITDSTSGTFLRGAFRTSLTGTFPRDTDQYTGLIRGDWHPNSTHAISIRVNYQNLHASNVPENGFGIATATVSSLAISNNGRVQVDNGYLSTQWTATISPKLLNELRVQTAPQTERQLPNGEGPQFRIGPMKTGFTFGGRDVLPGILHEKRWEWLDNLTPRRGRHEIKTGVDIHHMSDTNLC